MVSFTPPETTTLIGSALVLLSLVSMSQCRSDKLGVLNLMTDEKVQSYCLKYYPSFKTLPLDKSKAVGNRVAAMVAQDGCLPLRGINLTGAVALINDTSRCSLEVAARNFRDVSASALIIGLSDNRLDDAIYERKSSEPLDIVVGFVSRKNFAFLLKQVVPRGPMTGVLFTREYEMEPSLILVWFIATFSVGAGAFWAGSVSYQLYRYNVVRARKLEPRAPAPSLARRGSQAEPAAPAAGRRASDADKQREDTSLEDLADIQLTPTAILIFVVFMSSSLIVIYLLIRYLVYVIFGMFVLATSVALIGILEPLVHKIPVGSAKVPKFVLPCFNVALEVRQVCLILLSIGVAFSFVVIRHHPKSWLLQDSLGIIFCIYLIKTLRMPNLMVIATLLVLLFFYDIFFVFVTPLIIPASNPHNETNSFAKSSGKGDSIMVEVAKGGGSDEQIPMVMRVPRLGNSDLAACFGEYSILGLGDILIPGFLVAYVHSFDLIATQRRLYYIVTLIGYSAGLVVTFFALYLMNTAQPALLYLVPSTLTPVLLVARYRGELHDIWYGLKIFDEQDCRIAEHFVYLLCSSRMKPESRQPGTIKLSASTFSMASVLTSTWRLVQPETPPPSEEEAEPPAAKRKGSEPAKAPGSTAEQPPGSPSTKP